MWFIEKALKIFVFFIFCILLFNGKLFCVEISSHGKLSGNSDNQPLNPWIEYMKFFDILKNHGSTVYNDLGGEVEISNLYPTKEEQLSGLTTKYKIRFPIGKCPIFGKVIILKNGHEFIEEMNLEGLDMKHLFLYLMTGQISSTDTNNHGINFPTVALAQYSDQFKNLQSPIVKESIYECANYANKFEHNVTSVENLNNCFYQKTGSCIKHPFAYNLENKKCYILFPLLQRHDVNSKSNEANYFPIKFMNTTSFVYGSASIVRNWPQICPVKPIKGALFGFWKDGKCNPMNDDLYTHHYSFDICAIHLFFKSDSTHWGNYDEPNNCEQLPRQPDCLYNSPTGYAITSISMTDSDVYDLPPCIPASEGWRVEVSCKNFIDKLVVCKNGKWIAGDDKEITKCESSLTWANIKLSTNGTEELISEKENREIGENESTNLNDMKQSEGPPSAPVPNELNSRSRKISGDTLSTPAPKNAAESWQTRAFLNSFTVFCALIIILNYP